MMCLRADASAVDGEDKRQSHLVTGGGGYAGFHLGMALHKKGHKVSVLDIQEPTQAVPQGMTFLQCDIRHYQEVENALRGADYVYHMASYGMSGREQLNKKKIEQVNIEGTKNIIKACRKHSIQHLVYTSTYNVVFGGQTIENGDESLDYLPLDKHPDNYSRTKSMAEKIVLAANGTELDDGRTLYTCALRLAGVYGPGEQRHIPRIVRIIKRGMFAFTYGNADSLVEFLHVDNLVQAHIKAGEALATEADNIASGQAYFISDCKPINNFEFFRPLVEGLGYRFPTISLPLSLIYFLALLTEIVHFLVWRIYNFQPFLTRTEVYKTGVTHYFNNGKAKRDLGYVPTVQNDMEGVVQWYLAQGQQRSQRKMGLITTILRDLCLILIFASIVLSVLPMVA